MTARSGQPNVYSIAAHRGFADALVSGLIPRYAQDDVGLARLTLLLPSRRAARGITEAFVRVSGDRGSAGLLLPRMAVVGDLDSDEGLSALLDPLGGGTGGGADAIPAAAEPTHRWLRLAALIGQLEGEEAPKGAALLRRAFEAARTLDRLQVEGVDPEALMAEEVIALVGEQADHWRASTRRFLRLQAAWGLELAAAGQVDPPARRNMLFAAAAERWRESPPAHPIVAAGVTSASPALARLLRVVSELPGGAVILPDLDLALDEEVWRELGDAGQPAELGAPAFGREDAITHPQYHLKLLLNRMGVARGEVQPWHRSGMSAAPPTRSRAISSLFLPPAASASWVDLPESRRRLSAVRLMESEHPGEEAQAIAILMREALETPERRVALVTPDRALAARVVAHLRRWGIVADDTAGQPLPQTAAGRVLLLLAEVLAEGAPPVPLVALLSHPLVGQGDRGKGEERAAWLEQVRQLDLALRGPRPGVGLAPIGERVGQQRDEVLKAWWPGVAEVLAPLLALPGEALLADQFDALCAAAEALCGGIEGEGAVWAGADGRALSAFVEDLRDAARGVGTLLPGRDLPAVLREAMERVAVRPPWGGHPRVAVYGLIEARMARADLVICGGLVEGVWPNAAMPDALLPPAVLRQLGVPSGEFRIGLAAHDLAGAMGAPEVVLSWARRDDGAPVIPSRFVLRVQAMLGAELTAKHRERRAVELARFIDVGRTEPAHPRPQPNPSAEQRRVDISVTALDRLRGDPYQFYAQAILGLRRIDPLDAEPSPAWQGTAVHDILDAWHKSGAAPGTLAATARDVLDRMSAHPLARSLWRPRLVAALEWIDTELAELTDEGRRVLATERRGEMRVDGIRIHGRADRIDRLADGNLAIVDYKTGQPPSVRMVAEGFALQLGLIGLIARAGGFAEVAGEPDVFEYWSLSKSKDGEFGWRDEPLKIGRRRTGLLREEFLDKSEDYLRDAIARWILGAEPFTARLNPDIGGYNDYDQLMRLDEWLGLLGGEEAAQ
jgi:ATP-dependent helicase/nuclease subunit B